MKGQGKNQNLQNSKFRLFLYDINGFYIGEFLDFHFYKEKEFVCKTLDFLNFLNIFLYGFPELTKQ